MEILIEEWKEEYARDLIELSERWLKKYDLLEDADYIVLHHPHETVLDCGGMIYFARAEHKNVGTVTMIPMENGVYEMAKLTVDEPYRRMHIADALIEKAIDFAKKQHGKKIILFTNSRLIPAIHLYHKHGFREICHTDSEYEESDIKMALQI